MPEYIKRETAIKRVMETKWESGSDGAAAIEIVAATPAADVASVVRCKDCDVPHNKWTGCPKMNGLIPPPEHFCSYGERKEGDDNG